MKKRILALICALAMSVTMVAPAQASALTGSAVADNTAENAVSDNTEEPVITETIVSDVNPVYKDVVSGLSTSEETEFSLYSEDETPPENCETDLNVVINAIREAMKAREESLYIEYQHDADLGEQFLTEWVRMAVAETGNPKEGDYLRFHYQHSDGLAKTWTYSSGIKKSKIDISFQYYSNAEQEAAVDAAIETLIGTLGINNVMSDYEKVKAVYDYMCENITYDYDNLNDDTYTLKYSAYAALINRTSVCQGYANLLYRLLNEVGVDARIISGIGNGGPHSWNIIKLGDYYYLTDATWDAPRAEKGMEYEYFLKGSDNFTDHVCDEEYAGDEFTAAYPIDAEDYVYVPVEIVAEGSCGDNATWTLDVDGELRISGSGAITDNTEFGEYKDQIKTLVIEEGITEIGESVFNKYSGFTGSLELPDSLTSIGDMAFFCCSGFTGNLELPDNLTDLGEGVFSQCSGLNGNLTLPENLKSIGNEAFRSCTGLKGNLELPESLTSIGESAFYGCTGFTGDLELPDNLINIGISAFEGCTGFDGRLKLPQNLKTIESGVFMNCTGLIGELELPEGLTKVDMYAFTSCSGFDGNLELPESLVSVGYNAFGSTSFDKIIVRNASCDIEQSKPTLPQNAIINGYIDSTAHAYAKKFGRDFLCILHLWNENFTIDKESSCEEEGTKSIHCSVCDIVDESTREIISATGHTYATVLSNDTYNHWYECHCGVKKDVNSHEFEWLVDLEPTEEMTGLKHEECTVCDYKRNVGTVIEKLPHTHNIKYIEFKAQTCEEDGNKEHYFCTKCNKYYQDESGTIELVYDTILLPATGHTHSDIWSNDEDSHWYECHCGDKKAVEEHEFEWVVDKKATEEETGLKHEECVVCKYIRNKDTEIEKLSHTHDMKSVAAMKPTCEEEGNIDYFTCIKCNKNYKDEAGMIEFTAEEIMLSATGHNHSEEWSKDEENHWHECICGDKKTVEEHEFEWVVDKQATEEETGLKHEECVVCKYIRNKDTEIEKLPHTHNIKSVAAMKPTCEEDGNIDYFTCIKCNKNYKDEAAVVELTAEEIILSATGHSHSEEWSNDDDNHWHECICGDKKTVENHEYEWVVDKKATEEETGLKHEECTTCKYSRNENTEIEKLPHTQDLFSYTMQTDGTVWIDGVNGELPEELVIPGEIDGYKVTGIYYNVFKYRDELIKVEIPEGITYIWSDTFSHCNNLEYVKLPVSLKSCWGIFEECPKLKTAGPVGGGYNIEYSWVETIQDGAFCDTKHLSEVTIAPTIKTIGWGAFENCDGLLSVALPDGLEVLEKECFYDCDRLTSVVMQSVKSIDDYAFYGCDNLEYINLPEGLETIGQNILSECGKLETAGPIEGDYNIEYGWKNKIPGHVFEGLNSLTDVSFPSTLKKIGEAAFFDCDGLKNIILPEEMEEISYAAFKSCDNLEYIKIQSKSCDVLSEVFAECPKLKTAGPIGGGYNVEFSWDKELPEYLFSNYTWSGLTSIILPDGVEKIGNNAFYGCANLEYVKIPASVEIIEDSVFDGCTNLKTAGPIGGGYNIEVGWNVEIPDTAFMSCTSLVSVNIPDSIKHIGESAFYGCTSLSSFDFPSELKVINYNAFGGCTSLTEICFPDKGIEVYASAFNDCSNIEKIVIPKNVKFNGNVFERCSKIKTAGPIGGGYDLEFELTNEVPDSFFAGYDDLESIVLPKTISKIGYYAFAYCENLTEIELPNNVNEINQSAFYQCESLKELTIPNGVSLLDWNTFGECKKLEKVIIPKTVKELSLDVFRNCFNLTIYGFEGTAVEDYAKVNEIPFVALEDLSFSDVRATDWFYSAVDFVARNGLMTGMNETTFGPAINLSRAQFAVILWRMNGSPVMDYRATFPDVPAGTWYTDAVLWANQKGIITGYSHNGHFGSADNITREQMALMMFRYGNFKGFDVSQRADFGAFKDAASVSGFAKEAMQWTVANGIITGKQNGTALEPQGNASRAECATIIMRFMNTYE